MSFSPQSRKIQLRRPTFGCLKHVPGRSVEFCRAAGSSTRRRTVRDHRTFAFFLLDSARDIDTTQYTLEPHLEKLDRVPFARWGAAFGQRWFCSEHSRTQREGEGAPIVNVSDRLKLRKKVGE